MTHWSTATDRNQVVQILKEAATHVSRLVYDRTEAATAFELMTEKQRNEYLLMKKAAAFLSQQGLEVDIQWDREDPDGPLDFVGTIDGMPWGFELKALRADPEGYHRKVGHPNEQKSLEQQLESLAAPLPEIRDDAGTLQKALDKAVRDAGKPSKIDDLNGAKYCLVVHNYQFTYVDAWRTVTLPDFALFDAVIVLHQDTIAPASTWEVLCQTGIGKPLASQDIEDLADIAKFKASRTRGPDPELVRYAWALLESAESICDEIPQTFGPGG